MMPATTKISSLQSPVKINLLTNGAFEYGVEAEVAFFAVAAELGSDG